MKKLIAILMVCALLTGTALAAGWTEGRSPSKPYLGQPEADFSKTIGYMMRYPNAKMPINTYCDTLKVFMPRDDVAVGIGKVSVFEAGSEEPLMVVDFEDGVSVELRPMTEEEMDGLLWGGGVVYDILLPYSLELGGEYYVTMDAGCLASADWKMTNSAITDPEKWKFSVEGEFGINNLHYNAAEAEADEAEADEAEDEAGETEAEAESDAEAAEDAEPELRIRPEVGDTVTFDLVLDGDAASAVVYSENDAVLFDIPAFTESGTYTGVVNAEEVSWAILFLGEDGSVVEYIDLSR